MEEKEISTESMFEKLMTGLDGLVKSFALKAEVTPEPGIQEAPVQEAPKAAALPAGEYTLMDGTVIKVDETGMITEAIVVEAPAPAEAPAPEPPMEDKSKEKEMLATIQAQIDEMKKKMEATEARAIQAEGEVVAMKKLTVGSDKGPQAAAQFTKEPSTPEAPNGMDELAKVIAKKMRGY